MGNSRRILIRADASNEVGFGHMSRCLRLATAMRNKGVDPVFIITTQDEIPRKSIRSLGFDFFEIPVQKTYETEISYYPPKDKIILVDLTNNKALSDKDGFARYLNHLSSHNYKIIFLDGMFGESFSHPQKPAMNAIIQPYLGAETGKAPECDHWLAGGQYTILDEKYSHLPQRSPLKGAQNIIVTFGGADPQGITALATQSLKQSTGKFSARIVIGPYFSNEHSATIKTITNGDNRFTLIENCLDLIPHYLWGDVAIGGSGTSRYEFAATGLPCLFTAIYRYHDDLSRIFAGYGSAQYLGYYEDVSPETWSAEAIQLINNYNSRDIMVRNGYKWIDRNGTDSLVNKLLATLDF